MKTNYILVVLLSLLLTALLLLVSPFEFDKYLIEFKRSHMHQGAESIAFADMNGDGIDDFFECGYQQLGMRVSGCTCRLMDESKIMPTALEQFNVPNLIRGSRQVWSSDYDHDGNTEIWMLSAEKEELFLYGFEGPDLNGHQYRFPLDSAKSHKGAFHIGFRLSYELDLNKDGIDELLFQISNGFPIHPRRSYLVGISNDTIIKSPSTSAVFNMHYSSFLSDSTRYFTGPSGSPGNHKDTVALPFPDTKGYVFALDENLEFLFEPFPVTDYPNGNVNYPFGDHSITVIHNAVANQELLVQKRIAKTGELLEEKEFKTSSARSALSNGKVFLFLDDRVIKLKNDLSQEKEFQVDFFLGGSMNMDLNGDGKDEFILLDRTLGKSYVLDHQMEELTLLPKIMNTSEIRLRHMGSAGTEFASLEKDEVVFYTYSANTFYWFRWPYYIFLALLSLGVSSLFFRIYRKNIEGRFEKEREFNRLQILSLKNQIDPHFALNALNSIDWMYKQKEHRKASRFMEIYSRLVHQTVNSSDRISVTLFDELSFCRKFCELEKMRDEEFKYEINVEEKVDTFEVEVPRQLIFTHVENAVKHGLRPKSDDKLLEIEVIRKGSDLLIKIENNGLAYRKKGSTSGTGKGLEIHDQLIDIYHELKKVVIKSEIGPCESGEGTCVKMVLEGVFGTTHK